MSTRELGAAGEQKAAEHLVRSGWTILERNYRAAGKEVDLIARRGRVLAFIEVKSRRGHRFGHPLASVVATKRQAIRSVAEAWIARFGAVDLQYRFDAIAVIWRRNGSCWLQHVENAWGI